ncbi:MAG: hypothetical protein HKN23_12345 [Verrucomicrobiales bacterium]|nr:hypothetical protein [Verrucomicrobiales bacterium]
MNSRRVIWIVWAVVMAVYGVMNFISVRSHEKPDETTLLGWGIAMPVLTNLVWWMIAFRTRRFLGNRWWAVGIATAIAVGLAGLLSMIALAQSAAP